MRSILLSTLVLASIESIAALIQLTNNPYTSGPYKPVAYYIGKEAPQNPVGFEQCKSASSYTLDTSTPVLSLDYGSEVAGFPYVDISSFDGDYAQIELKYSEPYEGLSLPYGDGPWYGSNYQTTPSFAR